MPLSRRVLLGIGVCVVCVACGAKSGLQDHDAGFRAEDAGASLRPDAGVRPARDAGPRDAGDPLADEPLPPMFPPEEPPEPTVATIGAGYSHTCAVREGSVYCWGNNEQAILGVDTGSVDVTVPTRVPGVDGAIGVAVGQSHVCALHAGGAVTCWGANDAAQLGHGLDAPGGRSSPARPPGAVVELPPVVEAVAGGGFTLARDAEGAVYQWGGDILDLGGPEHSSVPRLASDLSPVFHMNAGDQHVCMVDAGRRVTCWGSSHQGSFGMNSRFDSRGATPVPEFTGAVQLAGDAFNCALRGDGTVTCCPLTDGHVILREPCGPVPHLTGAIRIEASAAHVCAILRDRTVWCWGQDNDGTISVKTEGMYVPRPVWVRGVEEAVELAAGYAHVCALEADGEILCWGKNDEGQLGIGTLDDETHWATPVVFPP